MELHSKIKAALLEIDFVNRYRLLSKRYPFADESFERYSNEEVYKILEELGYHFKFNKKENFFGLIESMAPFDFQFNISLKYGIVEFIWGLTENGQRLTLGGPWGLIGDLVLGEDCQIKKPAFRNYKDLTEILIEGFKLYSDFKKAIIKSNINEPDVR